MIDPEVFREQCAVNLLKSVERATHLRAFVGLDGFVDEIVHVVDKRDDAEHFSRIPTIARLGERISAAAGHSTNIEMVNQRTKLGGNGPIMANALARLGIKVTYVGALGYPNLHPVFNEFAHRADGSARVEQNGLARLHLAGGPFGDGAFGVEAVERAPPQRRLRLAFHRYRAPVGPRDQPLRHQQTQVAANR